MRDVPPGVLADLSSGSTESVNLMEWLAADMSALALAVSKAAACPNVRASLSDSALTMSGLGITGRLAVAGGAIARAIPSLAGPSFEFLASHRSDLVRQWACYAVNDRSVPLALVDRAIATKRFATDSNMSVRETAWMAFRPHLISDLIGGIRVLTHMSKDADHNVRRFAIEVSRPRSVWGCHIDALKRDPGLAIDLLENTRSDPSRYVQLAVGNWLNDASKTRPEWVAALCERWRAENDRCTDRIVKRGTRSFERSRNKQTALERLL